jgi:hypothetical protein
MTTTTTESPATDETAYFYLLRIQWQHPSGALATSVVHGVAPVRPGMSRHKLFTMLRDEAIARTGAPSTADVTSFELAPNIL